MATRSRRRPIKAFACVAAIATAAITITACDGRLAATPANGGNTSTESSAATKPASKQPTASSQTSTTATATPTPGPSLIWSDEFTGAAGAAPSPKIWTPKTGGSGWGNQELECYTNARGNSDLDGTGDLVITALHAPGHICSDGARNNYTSARLSTKDLYTTKYGRIAIRAKVPTGYGLWPAFWALGDNHDSAGWPKSGEIDVTEVLGRQPNITHGSLHGPEANGSAYDLSGSYQTAAPLSAAFHVYGVDWTPTSVSFDFDGHVYYTATKQTVQKSGQWVFDHPFYLLINVAVGGSWPGSPNSSTTWPQTMTVDWVREYSL